MVNDKNQKNNSSQIETEHFSGLTQLHVLKNLSDKLHFHITVPALQSEITRCEKTAKFILSCLLKDGSISKVTFNQLYLGFQETIQNAYEHGSIQLGSNKKEALLDKEELEKVLKEAEISHNESITCSFEICPKTIVITVSDTGPGFIKSETQVLDHTSAEHNESLRDQSDKNKLGEEKLSGRGITIVESVFDEVSWCDEGRTCVMLKKLVEPL